MPDQPAKARPEPRRDDGPTALWLLAALAALAALGAQGLAPALPGVWVGVDHVITAVKLASAFCSQLFAVLSAVAMVSLLVTVARSHLPAHLRASAVGTGVLVSLAVMISSGVPLPNLSRLVVAVSAAALALLAGRECLPMHTHRAAAALIIVIAVAGLARVGAIVSSLLYLSPGHVAWLVVARSLASAADALVATAVLVALAAVLVARELDGSRRWRWRLVPLVVLAVLSAALIWVTWLGSRPESEGASLLVARAGRALLSGPPPYAPEMFRIGWQIVAWLGVALVLVLAPRGRVMAAVLALALVARGSLEIPLCAAALVMAAMALVLHPGPELHREMAALEAMSHRRERARTPRDAPL